MPNKYEKLTEPHKIISNIFSNIGAGMEAGKNLKRCSVLKQGNTSYSDTSKPADKAIEGCNQGSILKIVSAGIHIAKHSADEYIKTRESEIEELKIVNKIQLVTNEALNKQNKLFRAQLRKFGQVFDNCGGKEVDAEFNEEEYNKTKKGEK